MHEWAWLVLLPGSAAGALAASALASMLASGASPAADGCRLIRAAGACSLAHAVCQLLAAYRGTTGLYVHPFGCPDNGQAGLGRSGPSAPFATTVPAAQSQPFEGSLHMHPRPQHLRHIPFRWCCACDSLPCLLPIVMRGPSLWGSCRPCLEAQASGLIPCCC